MAMITSCDCGCLLVVDGMKFIEENNYCCFGVARDLLSTSTRAAISTIHRCSIKHILGVILYWLMTNSGSPFQAEWWHFQ